MNTHKKIHFIKQNNNIISRLTRAIKRYGFSSVLIRAIAKLLNADLDFQYAKNKAWNILLKKYNFKVAYGPFKGMQLNKKIWWSENDRITQTLGIYEEHILKKLIYFSKNGASLLIDIGAADGYFAVGLTYANIYNQAYAFEIEQKARQRILENATANNCVHKVKIFGEANITSVADALNGIDKATILIDIEGAEYDLISDEMLSILTNHYIICELHPYMIDQGDKHQQDLINRASKYFNTEIIQRNFYTPNLFPEFNDLTDEERLVAVGEGRGKNMQWMVLSPK